MKTLLGLTLVLLALAPAPAVAERPGRGLTGPFEIEFLRSIIDHHFSALRMTELATGTDERRDAEISPDEGTSPTPGFEESGAKAELDEVKSLARRNNRGQREEILVAQRLLQEWYGIRHEPRVPESAQPAIALLERASSGADFDQEFLQVFSRHHFVATERATECLVGWELRHDELRRYCGSILQAQLTDIDDMRHLLCARFDVCGYQPFGDPRGRQ